MPSFRPFPSQSVVAPILRMVAAMNHKGAAHVPRETGRSVLVNEAAELLGVSRRTVYYRIQAGKLRTIRTRGGSSRVLLASIEVLLREARGLPPLPGRAEGEGESTTAGSDTKPLAL